MPPCSFFQSRELFSAKTSLRKGGHVKTMMEAEIARTCVAA
jgi:hypothetical protein